MCCQALPVLMNQIRFNARVLTINGLRAEVPGRRPNTKPSGQGILRIKHKIMESSQIGIPSNPRRDERTAVTVLLRNHLAHHAGAKWPFEFARFVEADLSSGKQQRDPRAGACATWRAIE